jgi:hypothetical protein
LSNKKGCGIFYSLVIERLHIPATFYHHFYGLIRSGEAGLCHRRSGKPVVTVSSGKEYSNIVSVYSNIIMTQNYKLKIFFVNKKK